MQKILHTNNITPLSVSITHHLIINIIIMTLHNAVSFEAFSEITDFLINNGYDWDAYCKLL